MDNRIISEIEYHKYAALLAHMAGEEFFQAKDTPKALEIFRKMNDSFTRECAKYRYGLVKNLKEYSKANRFQSDELASFLYNPACFITFGNSDSMAIVTIDDFDPTIRLTSRPTIPVQQACLTFCPTLKSLGLSKRKDLFFELHELCDPKFGMDDGQARKKYGLRNEEIDTLANRSCADKAGKALREKLTFQELEKYIGKSKDEDILKVIGKMVSPKLPFVSERPLLAVTYFKLHGMAILGPGLLMQQTIYKVMADEIKSTLKSLEGTLNQCDELDITKDDIKSFRCCFLDPQGWSDLATIVVCRNYSVITSVIAVLRHLTFGRLYDKEPKLKDAIECFGIHKMIDGANDPPMRKDHIFWSAYTTLGITYEAFAKDGFRAEEANYSGKVAADTRLNLYPGHFIEASKATFERGVGRKKQQRFIANREPLKGRYAWYLFGHDDFSYEQLPQNKDQVNSAVKLNHLVEQIKCMRDCKGSAWPRNKPFIKYTMGVWTDLRVPVPLSLLTDIITETSPEDKEQRKKHKYIQSVLADIREKLFEKKRAKLCLNKLVDSLRKIRLPAPLSHSIIYLYNDFARYLCDCFTFDSVLDLYDIFLTTYLLLTEKLPKSLQAKLKTLADIKKDGDAQCRVFLSEEDIGNIVELVDLMQAALAHRVQIAFREAERWNYAIDVKGGGLDRLLNAADVPLKCGLGILKRVIAGWTDLPKIDEQEIATIEEQTKVSGALKISQNIRSFSHRICIGNNPDIFLASLDLNLSHLTRPEALCIHLHEAAHLVKDFLQSQGVELMDGSTAEYLSGIDLNNLGTVQKNDLYGTIQERYDDIFSEMLVYQFLFYEEMGKKSGKKLFYNEHNTYFRHYLANYSFDPISYCDDDRDTFRRMLEVMIRGFLITDPFRVRKSMPKFYQIKIEPTKAQINAAYERFVKAVKNAGPYFFEFSRLWPKEEDKEGQDYIERQFKSVFKLSYPTICKIWDTTQAIYRGICYGKPEKGKWGTDPANEVAYKHFQKQIRTGLKKGRPLMRILGKIPEHKSDSERYNRLDTFFVIRHLLREHISRVFKGINAAKSEVCLHRLPESGQPNFNRGELLKGMTKWHTQLVDRNASVLFAVDPQTRDDYMRRRIVIIKTFWDISTNLRARRMKNFLTSLE